MRNTSRPLVKFHAVSVLNIWTTITKGCVEIELTFHGLNNEDGSITIELDDFTPKFWNL